MRLTKFNPEIGQYEYIETAKTQAEFNAQRKAVIQRLGEFEDRAEWISVEERLPEECKNVLCFARNKTMIAFMEKVEDCGEFVPVFWDWVAYDRDDTYDEVCATHWMPLPQPPKMKGECDEQR